MPDENNLKQERFILAHGFREVSAWSAGSLVSGAGGGTASWWREWGRKAAHPQLTGARREARKRRGNGGNSLGQATAPRT